MVAPLVEALLLRAMRRRAEDVPAARPTRLVSPPRLVASVSYVVDRTSALVLRPGSDVEVRPAGSLVLPSLLGRNAPTYVVVTHDPVDVWLRIGPFETLDDRVVHQVELRLTVTLSDSESGLRELVESCAAADSAGSGSDHPTALDDAILDRLAREVAARTTEAVRRRTLTDLTGLSLGVLLDGSLPSTFLGGQVTRSSLEVVDVDWPTEGRGWPTAPAPGGATGTPRPVPR